MDFLVVPTAGFRLLFVLIILRHERRRLISLSVTAHPTAEWIAHQITDAFPWDEAPDHLIRDRDASYGSAVTKRLAAMGIRDHPIAPRSPWQNGHAERSAGSALITSSSWARSICAGSLRLTRAITTNSERISPWARTRRRIGRFNGSVGSPRDRFSADFIINIVGCSFWQAQGVPPVG
jgi:transposase InsO family protein